MITEDTVSTQTQAAWIFSMDDDAYNRRRRRSAEPASAVGYQFERVYDMVASEAIVLCDDRGRSLSVVGDNQLCRLLSQSVPAIFHGDAQRQVQLKAMEIVRPNLDWQHISIRPIPVPHAQKRLFVASVSESTFNEAGVQHASVGVRRILGIRKPGGASKAEVITSRDRLAYDVVRTLEAGYYDFHASPLLHQLRTKNGDNPSRRAYMVALNAMLGRLDQRLDREGLLVERPSAWSRWFARGDALAGGLRLRRFELPVRQLQGRKRVGTLHIEMQVFERAFGIVAPPNATLYLNN